jgi:hypothetical protein
VERLAARPQVAGIGLHLVAIKPPSPHPTRWAAPDANRSQRICAARYGRVRNRCYCSAHQNVAATTPKRDSPRAACPIPRVMALLTGPEVRVGNFSRHFQQNSTPSMVVWAPQRLHLRLMSVTPGCGDPNRPASIPGRPCAPPAVIPAARRPRWGSPPVQPSRGLPLTASPAFGLSAAVPSFPMGRSASS